MVRRLGAGERPVRELMYVPTDLEIVQISDRPRTLSFPATERSARMCVRMSSTVMFASPSLLKLFSTQAGAYTLPPLAGCEHCQ